MASDHPDHGAEVEEARELLLERPEPARCRWPQLAGLAALAVFAASAAALCLSRGGPGRAGAPAAAPGARALLQTTTNSSNSDGSYCPAAGENCTALRCCAAIGYQCYKKNSAWASCQLNCTKNKPMPGDINNDTWDCEELGPRTPEPAVVDWLTGAERGKDCRAKTFCTGTDDHCYLKNEAWGSCMPKCDPSVTLTHNWTCKQLY